MYEDAIKTSGHEGEIELRELTELVLESLELDRRVAAVDPAPTQRDQLSRSHAGERPVTRRGCLEGSASSSQRCNRCVPRPGEVPE